MRSLKKRKKTKADDIKRLQTVVSKACQGFKAPENLTVSQWADRYRTLSAENSAESGRWKTSRTPYMKEIMDAFTQDNVNRLVVVASSQVGKSEALLNMMGYAVDQDPGPMMFVQPTVDAAQDFSKRRIAPMIRDTECLRKKMGTAKAKSGDTTILKKSFPGGMLTLTGSNSPTSLASVPARYVFGDEIDRWSTNAGGEGDPMKLLEARTKTFYNKKIVQVSTPTIKNHSAIEKAFKRGTQEYWCTKCPHCGEYSFIRFKNISFEYETVIADREEQYLVKNVSWICPECGCVTPEEKVRKLKKKWIARSPEAIKNGCRSFWINGFASPWNQWEKIIVGFLEAKKDPERLKPVFNTDLGELWEERSDLGSSDDLASRAEEYGAELPDGVLCLTCGVDTQDDRLEYEVVGYGFNEENWGIEKGIIIGKPSEPKVWEQLDEIRHRKWRFADGKSLKISLTFMDSGGHYSQEVYENCADRMNDRIFPIKGAKDHDAPYISNARTTDIKKDGAKTGRKAWYYYIGVDAGKERIMSGLKVKEPGARMSHFPSDDGRGYDGKYYDGLLSERLVWKNNGWKWEKIPGHERNEALDCRNYANAAFKKLHPDMVTLKQKLEGTHKAPEKKMMVRKQKRHKRSEFAMEVW